MKRKRVGIIGGGAAGMAAAIAAASETESADGLVVRSIVRRS